MIRAAFSLLLATLLVASAGADEPPQRSVVTASAALVRSGPGEEFYPTGRLQAGEEVEIYRRKDNGWCAVRPPRGSFSYVRADHVRPTETENVLEVTQAGTKTRVGSRLKRAYQVEYVTLKEGERLQRLSGPIRLASSRYAWYRVAPPAGEFRWVDGRDLQASESAQLAVGNLALPAASIPAPVPPSATPVSQEVPPAEPAASSTPAQIAAGEPVPPRPTAAAPGGPAEPSMQGISTEKLTQSSRGQMTTEPIQTPPTPVRDGIVLASHTEALDRDEGNTAPEESPSEADRAPAAWTAVDARPLADQRPVASGPTRAVIVDADPDLRLAEIELALSREVTQEVDRWNLGPLRRQLQQLAPYLPDASGIRSAQQLAERIEEFAALQRRHHDLATPTEADRAQTISLASALSPRPVSGGLAATLAGSPPDPPNHFLAREAAIRRQAENVHYAGQGWLVPVISSQANLPRFALTDPQGTILAFVSPRPGLNLRRYQRREVGIVGRETSRAEESTPHLVAERVVVLSRHDRY